MESTTKGKVYQVARIDGNVRFYKINARHWYHAGWIYKTRKEVTHEHCKQAHNC